VFLLVPAENLLKTPIVTTKWKILSLNTKLELAHMRSWQPLKERNKELQSNFSNILYDIKEQGKIW
jgi:hypothetical protein